MNYYDEIKNKLIENEVYEKVKKYNFLLDNYDDIFNQKTDLIISWRNPHLDMDDMKKLFNVVYNGLNDKMLICIQMLVYYRMEQNMNIKF